MFGEEVAESYLQDLFSHIIYTHDETSLISTYCASISMYPFLINGLKTLGGSSGAPQHIKSFCGGFINLCFLVASQFAGAIATVEFLTYFDHFMRKDYGDDYYLRANEVVDHFTNETILSTIHNYFGQVVYSLNQPAAARGAQSVFWNISYFDEGYFKGVFGDFVFPDGDVPCWESVKWLQKTFMVWFNNERLITPDLTFPVETFSLLDDGKKFVDEESADWVAEMYARKHSFFTYRSGSVDSLASCCRLRNGMEDNAFSYTLGAGGIMTGSKGVCTININRVVQDWYNTSRQTMTLAEYLTPIVNRVHKYLKAHNEIIWDYYRAGLLTVFNAGFVDLDKQYLTVGINGFVEGAEFLGIDIDPFNQEYKDYTKSILGTIAELNKSARAQHIKFNTELVPKPKISGHVKSNLIDLEVLAAKMQGRQGGSLNTP